MRSELELPLQVRGIRPFLGAKDWERSKAFYTGLGFSIVDLGPQLSLCERDGFGFYLQKAYVKDWVENTQVFLECSDLEAEWARLRACDLAKTFPPARVEPIIQQPWGREFFVHDPSGILWHFGSFG